MKKSAPIEMSEEDYQVNTDEYNGVCIACGEIRECCEPDARHYPCAACGQRKVFGVEQALLEGLLTIV